MIDRARDLIRGAMARREDASATPS
jgi:hypothetical protein